VSMELLDFGTTPYSSTKISITNQAATSISTNIHQKCQILPHKLAYSM